MNLIVLSRRRLGGPIRFPDEAYNARHGCDYVFIDVAQAGIDVRDRVRELEE